jgi:chromosomal replication initiator protein
MELTADQLWSRVLVVAREGLAEYTYRTWLADTKAVALTDDALLVEVPNEFHLGLVEDRFGRLLRDLVHRVTGREMVLTFHISQGGRKTRLPAIEVTPSAQADTVAAGQAIAPRPRLNERYSFERFVVGNHNQLATAACGAVAEKPARAYNPLFLYGGVGLGKTHLMHAIGNQILEVDPTTRVGYVTTEAFTNDVVTSIRQGTMVEFRRHYRRLDLLLVDDVQFLTGKERTQEEFFHTFNALYDARKQIVLTSDRPPKEIRGLEERLVSRFEWGLVADIQSPDYETRIAILRKKADDDGLELEDDVMDYVARSCKSSVRELEGAIIKLLAYSSLTNQEITVELAQTSLQAAISPAEQSGKVTPERIRDLVADEWKVRPEALSTKRRTKDLTVPRQVAMYLIREILAYPLVQIGSVFGGRDHSTVIHSIRKVEGEMQADPDLKRRIEDMKLRLTRT